MYDFKTLSPADFEELTRDLFQRDSGITLESFKAGRDQGIDLRYASSTDQTLIVQCKHFAGSSVANLIRAIERSELPKIKRLNPDRYVLVTSLGLTPANRFTIKELCAPHIVSTCDVVGAEDLNNLLRKHPEIETQHFKLWMSSTAVMQRVLHNAERVQTDFDIERIKRAIPLYVQTSNYSRAIEILKEHKIVIIAGVPGVGKTTLADMILFAHLESGYHPVVIQSNVAEGRAQFQNELRQVFYFDDFLGETFLGNRSDFLGRKEDSAVLDFIGMIARSKHARLVLTTREHILQHAYQISQRFERQRPELRGRQCVLSLADYTLVERARILYNHIYFSDLSREHKLELLRDEFYLDILKHRNFNPRLVEWLSRFANVRRVPVADYRTEVQRVLENPNQLWRIAFEQQISEAARSAVLALYTLGGKANLDRLKDAWSAIHNYRVQKYRLRHAPEDWRRCLQDLEGGFFAFTNREAAFVNPSVKDFIDATLVECEEHLDDLLASACLFEQVVSIWRLAQSEKGPRLQHALRESPGKLLAAVSRNLDKPHEQIVSFPSGTGTRKRDVNPEVRLRTLISIADGARSQEALGSAQAYLAQVLTLWATEVPDLETALDCLRVIDGSDWTVLSGSEIHNPLKRAIMAELQAVPRSGEIFSVVSYAEGDAANWTADDRRSLKGICEQYLETYFDEELSDYDEAELETFSETIESIGYSCAIDVTSYLDQISTRIDEIRKPEEDEDRPVREWDGPRRTPEKGPEEEIKRLFESLLP